MIKQSPAYIFEPILPLDLVYIIDSFLPRFQKKKPQQISPSMQKELRKIQHMSLHGKNDMFMKDLIDFCLD